MLVETPAFAETGFDSFEAELVRRLACIAGQRGDLANAARLLSCSDAIYKHSKCCPYVQDRKIAGDLRALLEAKLHIEELGNLKAEGARMPLKEAHELMTALLANDGVPTTA